MDDTINSLIVNFLMTLNEIARICPEDENDENEMTNKLNGLMYFGTSFFTENDAKNLVDFVNNWNENS